MARDNMGWLFNSSFLRGLFNAGGGDPNEPKAKPKSAYTSEEQIQKDNEFARLLLARQHAPEYFVRNAVVARKIGDPIPQFTGDVNRVAPRGVDVLPSGVTLKDVVDTKDGYGFFHPQNGNWIPVDISAITQKYGQKK